jgi:hypothetical protein
VEWWVVVKQDLDVTKRARRNLKEKFTYPAIFYYEYENGDIPFAVLLNEKNNIVRYTKNAKQQLIGESYEFIKDCYKMNLGSTSEAELFIVDDASEDDILRILKKVKESKFTKTIGD